MTVPPEPQTTKQTPESSTRFAIAQIVIFLGVAAAILGGAILIKGMIGALGGSEGDAMLAGAGLVLLLGALIVLGIGLMLRPRREPSSTD